MTRLILAAIAVLTLSIASFAQPRMDGDPKEMLESRMARLDSLLDLSDAQEAAILQLNLEMMDELKTLRDESGGDRQAMGQKMRSLRDRHDQEVMEMLDEEQQAAYSELRETEQEEMRNRFRERGGRRGGRPPGQ